MQIDKEKCVGCGNCVPVCTMGVISVVNGRSQVNEEECVECHTCYRTLRNEGYNPTLVRSVRWVLRQFHLAYDPPPDVCPTGALTPPTLEWPRSLRATFSDPTLKHPSTGIGGRGTEEIKSNDVTGRLKAGEIGFAVELGRPGLGARFRDLQTVAMALAKAGVQFEPNNPVTHLMADIKTGALHADVLNEKVMSAIIECRADAALVPGILAALRRAAGEIESVISAGIAGRCDPDGSVPYAEMARASGFNLSLNGKTNLGLGRPLFAERSPAAPSSTGRA
jgi:ferredoxin